MADVLGGAAAGAAAGSVVPGIGTVAGGVIGGIAGLFGGKKKKKKAAPPPPPPPDPRQFWGGSQGAQAADVTRYRDMGSQTYNPARINPRFTNQSRAQQMYGLSQQQQALGLAHNAATGAVPSAAEIYGQRMIDDSINAQMAMAASAAGGPSAQASAARQAAFQGVQTQQQGARDLAALRADEMARGRELYGNLSGAYTDAASGVRDADFQHAYGQAGLDDRAMDRNLQNQRFYEQLAWDTNKQVQDDFRGQTSNANEAWARGRELKLRDEDQEWGKIRDIGNFAASTAGAAAMLSDARTKDVYMPLHSDARSKYIVSDPAAKRQAFIEGINFGDAQMQYAAGAGPEPTAPSYVDGRRQPRTAEGSPGRSLVVQKHGEHPSAALSWQRDEDPMAEANRSQAASAYTYKPGFDAVAGQTAGEVNVGPMADTMAADPIASTAVTKDPNTGLLGLDKDKLMKLQSAGISSLQRQVDKLKGMFGR